MAQKSLPMLARFEAMVHTEPNSGCHLWAGAKTKKGYGVITHSRPLHRTPGIKAHRAAWILYRGSIPAGMFVCHRCDMRLCVNPDHLYLGTPQDNASDMARRGRGRVGALPYGAAKQKGGGFISRIRAGGNYLYLGSFATAVEASAAAAAAKIATHGAHP